MKRISLVLIPFVLVLVCSCQPVVTENDAQSTPMHKILFFGNSLTAGYGLQDPLKNFPSQLQTLATEAGFELKALNAGISGETSAQAQMRLPALLRLAPDVLVLELGINDALQGYPPDEVQVHLVRIIRAFRQNDPDLPVLLLGFEPQDIGFQPVHPAYGQLYHKIAEQENCHLIPSILNSILPEEDKMLPDQLHPTASGYRVIAEQVWKELQYLLA